MKNTAIFLTPGSETDPKHDVGRHANSRRSITANIYHLIKPHFFSVRMLHVLILCAIGIFVSNAYAHEAGDWILKLGAAQVSPKSDNGNALGNTVDLDVNSNVRPSFTVTYMATRHIGIELLGVLPYHHDIRDSEGLGKIGSTEQLPPTLSLQWHFLPDSRVQPYVGIGLNYTHFFDTHSRGAISGSHLKLKDSWGLAAQLGIDFKLDDRWFMNADIRYIDIDSTVKLDGERIGTAHIDPWVTTVAIGYSF